MLQQYQQQPDYTPYGGIGYGAQPNAGYFNYAATESSWYGSPSSGTDHAQMVSDGGGPQFLDHAGLSHNACNTHIGDSTGNFLNHGYHQAASTGASTSSAESFAANNHPVSQADMDPMADFLGGHQNMTETDKIIKEESIDWLSTIINDEVDHGNNRPDVVVGDGGGGGGVGGGVSGAGGNGKLVGDLHPCKGREANGRLPNFHQAFGSTEIGRFSQHEYYEPPKDAAIGECQSAGRSGSVAAQQSGAGTSQQPDEQQPTASTFEPPRQQNRRGRAQRGGGQNRRNKQTRTALAAAAATAAAVAAQQYAGYDVTGAAVGRHQTPPYHHHHQQDPYNRNHHHHVQQQRYHQEYHHQQQQPPPQTPYQNHQQEYYRPYDRMHYQQQQQQPPLPPNQYYNNNNGNNSSSNNGGAGGGSGVNNNSNREQSYNAGGYNRFHSCCSTEHIARPNHHHNYGPGQYYGDYNTYNQW